MLARSELLATGGKIVRRSIPQPVLRWLRPAARPVLSWVERGQDRPRVYVPDGMSCEAFFDQLRDAEIDYVVLRWFEDLPKVEPGEDLDLLVADRDLGALRALCQKRPGSIPCDVYSVSGLPGSEWRNTSYYPPALAEQILESAVTEDGRYRTPDRRKHFLSLAFHALYHKGYRSGLPANSPSDRPLSRPADHDYTSTLARLTESLEIRVDITMADLDAHLAEHGWRPSEDHLERLAKHNPWIADTLRLAPLDAALDDVALFVVRERAESPEGLKLVVAALERCGLDVLETRRLDDEQRARCAREVRGGNWGRGPWPTSGGDPAALVIVRDRQPIAVDDKTLESHPLLTNKRILTAKEAVRSAFNRPLKRSERCNAVHSSDHSRQAWNQIACVLGEDEALRLQGEARQMADR